MPDVTREEIRDALIDALAEVEGLAGGDFRRELSNRGELLYELESKVAECVIAALSEQFGVALPGPADLRSDQYATIEALTDLVQEALSTRAEV